MTTISKHNSKFYKLLLTRTLLNNYKCKQLQCILQLSVTSDSAVLCTVLPHFHIISTQLNSRLLKSWQTQP